MYYAVNVTLWLLYVSHMPINMAVSLYAICDVYRSLSRQGDELLMWTQKHRYIRAIPAWYVQSPDYTLSLCAICTYNEQCKNIALIFHTHFTHIYTTLFYICHSRFTFPSVLTDYVYYAYCAIRTEQRYPHLCRPS
jgi:hypothetical protein